MFAALQKGDYFYILRKTNEGPVLEIGQIDSVSAVKPMFGTYSATYNSIGAVDINVRVGSELYKFPQIPSNVDIFNHDRENVIITENRDKMMATVSAMVDSSKQALSEVPLHEVTVSRGEEMLAKLDPNVAKDKARDDELNALKMQVADMKNDMGEVLKLLRANVVDTKN